MSRSVYAVATMDTKGMELNYVADCLRRLASPSRQLTWERSVLPRSRPMSTAARYGHRRDAPRRRRSRHRGNRDGAALRRYLVEQSEAGNVSAVFGIGGSGGTALITAAMRALPIGLPKLMVSTVASGNTAAYVDCSDITMMYSVVDVAGLNVVSERILGNAAHAIAGMVGHQIEQRENVQRLG